MSLLGDRLTIAPKAQAMFDAQAREREARESQGRLAASLDAAFWKLKSSRIRVSPSHTTRASSIGHDCLRYLFYERTAGEMRTPHGPELQAIFDLGNEVEGYVLRELEAMGAKIHQRGRDYHDRARELTGHVDAKLQMDGWARAVPVEIKGLNPYTAESIETLDDIRHCRQAWVRKYYAQLQTYLALGDDPLGIFVLMNKSTGKITFIECPRDDVFCAELLAKAETVKRAVAADDAPPRHQSAECERCPFAHVCLPDLSFGPGVKIITDPEIEALVKRRGELEEARREFDAIDKDLKKRLPEAPEIIVGEYVVIGRPQERKGFEVKPSRSFVREIRRIQKGTAQ